MPNYLEINRYIDPLIDCVFKAILGSIENIFLLIHFLNAVLELKKGSKIKSVEILNPYNDKEFIGDKLSIVDIKAKDENEKVYQIEIQIANHSYLIPRIIYNWASIYYSQIREGDNYKKLNPVISIWVLGETIFSEAKKCHLPFKIVDTKNNITLSDHLAIHLLQLPKWNYDGKIKSEKDRWIYLFKEGKKIDFNNPPKELQTKEMRQVMQVMKRFSESEKNFLLYQNRVNVLLKENTYVDAISRERKAKNEALKKLNLERKTKERESKAKNEALKKLNLEREAKEREREAKEIAEKKIEILKQTLIEKGINLEKI